MAKVKITLTHKKRIERLLMASAQDDRWITVKPNGPDKKGTPVRISDDGVVQAGMGGKFNGEKITEIRKSFVGAKTPKGHSKESNEQRPTFSKRISILQRSLEKKRAEVDRRIREHFDTVKQANEQPLNDKRNGAATLNKWDRQERSIVKHIESAKKTEEALERRIEWEKELNDRVNSTNVPGPIKDAIQSGELTQWRKFPNRFFVKGVDKARIVWDETKGELLMSHTWGMPDDQKEIFKKAFNNLKEKMSGYMQSLKESKEKAKKEIPQSPYFDVDYDEISWRDFKKSGVKYSRTKGMYYYPKGVEVPEKYRKYIKG